MRSPSHRTTVAIAMHDGFYGAGTGAGYANRAFLRIVASLLDHEVHLIILPVRLNRDSGEFDHDWHAETTSLLRVHGAEIAPVDNGTGGQARFSGLAAFKQLAISTASLLNDRLPSGTRNTIILFDVPFLGVPLLLRADLATQVIAVPRSTAILHDPGNADRVRFEHDGLAAVAHSGGKVAAISRFMRRHLQDRYHVPAAAIADLTDGLTAAETAFPSLDPAILPAPAAQGFLLALGRAQPYKGWDDLIDALALIENPCLPHAILAAVTEDPTPSAYQRHLMDRVRAGEINATVLTRFSRNIQDMLGHPALRLVVVPSRAEPFGRIPLEAYAAGAAPVVATTAGGLSEQVINGVTGLTANPEDPVSLAAAIQHALAMPPAAVQAMRAAGRHLLITQFDHDRAVADFLAEVAPWSLRRSTDARQPR